MKKCTFSKPFEEGELPTEFWPSVQWGHVLNSNEDQKAPVITSSHKEEHFLGAWEAILNCGTAYLSVRLCFFFLIVVVFDTLDFYVI